MQSDSQYPLAFSIQDPLGVNNKDSLPVNRLLVLSFVDGKGFITSDCNMLVF